VIVEQGFSLLFRAPNTSVATQSFFNPPSLTSPVHRKAQLLLGTQIYFCMILYVVATFGSAPLTQTMASHRPSSSSVEILQVTNAYGHINSPDIGDPEAYVQVYGRCLVETKEDIGDIKQQLYTLENASIVVPVLSLKESLDTPSHSS
jgi:hypothetical protein